MQEGILTPKEMQRPGNQMCMLLCACLPMLLHCESFQGRIKCQPRAIASHSRLAKETEILLYSLYITIE